MQLPLAAIALTFAHDAQEDRMVIAARDADGQQILMLLTRRLSGRVINGLGGLLKRSSAVASHAPAEMRDDVIYLEHQEALAKQHKSPQQPAAGGVRPAGATGPVRAILVTDIDISTKPTHFDLAFRHKDQALARMAVSRTVLHRMIDALTRRAAEADWALPISEDWLKSGEANFVLN